jgi:radical SAM superfamily enzyme YgiQ (UPF0313 family)
VSQRITNTVDVLFITPPREIPQKMDFPPIGLAYLSSYLKKAGIRTSVIDACPMSWNELARSISEKSPPIVGITCWTQERGQAFKTAKIVKEILPNTKIIIGGHQATAFPQNMFVQAFADAVVIGEGEQTTLELVSAFLDGRRLNEINGIAYKEDGKVVFTEPRDFIEDLDRIPYPNYTDFDLKNYLGIPDADGIAASIITSRGCPHACIFCSAGSFWKRKWRARSPANVVGEIEWLHRELGVRNFAFFDDNFTVNKNRAIQICQGIIEKNLPINWVASSHVTHINEELLAWMKKCGCFRIDFGIESGSPDVLKNINKGQTVDQIEEAFRMVHAAGIKPRAYLLVGCPGETEETIDETLSLMRKIKPYYSRTAEILIVFPGTKLCDIAKDQGLINDNYWLKTDETIHYTGEHSYEELKKLKDRLMKGMAENDGTLKALIEYWARKVYYGVPFLQKLRRLRRIFS